MLRIHPFGLRGFISKNRCVEQVGISSNPQALT